MRLFNVKTLILIIFITGILQMDIFNIQWKYLTTISIIHALVSVVFSVFYIIPFVNKHAYKYIVIRRVNSLIGWILGFILLIVILSGFYLFLVGNRGGDMIGIVSFNIHLYGSFVLIAFLLYHTKNKIPTATASLVFVMTLINPTSSYSFNKDFVSMKLENDKTMYHNEDWTNSTKCKSCHSEIFNQWADSNHKNLVESNPYYMVLEGIAAEVEGEEFRQWCMGCHNPSGLTTGLTKTSHNMTGNTLTSTLFEKKGKTLVENFKEHGNSRLEEGVSCLTCHRIMDAKSDGNSSYTLDLTNRKKYPFEDEESSMGSWLGHKFINAKPQEHKDSYMKPLYKEAKYCASCHDETSPITGKQIVSTFKQWEKSEYNNPKDKTKHKSCIDCHMTYLKDDKFSPLRGTSTDGGVIKDDVKVHYFSGSNHFLSGLKNKEHEDQTLQLLRTSAELDVNIKDGQIHVGVKNVGAGHHLPTGVADFRELWLDTTIKDANNKIVFSSGKLKEDGNLGDDARPFMKVFGDENGEPVGLLFWKYKTLLKDTRIPAKERRVEVYDLPKELNYPLNVDVKLNFRIYPQWVTNIVRNVFPELPNPPVVKLENIVKKFNKK
ncbi:multiheme c-type cytochrome [Arcobacter sp. LA11]|uniref:multiheme c-type cytochrome n=1 Tax=Arcobacter sp. LA11 TaxID=1898176 RepID=UPI0009324398|nr:multiheme c-type cytochrome [Arcobacter sp. LA11]